jgi:hypothetical protein
MSDDLFAFESLEDNIEDLELETDDIKDAKGMQNILKALGENNFSYYENFGTSSIQRSKEWTAEAYPALRWMSAVGKTEMDWAEARRQGRKKGDKKGPWPSTVHDTEKTGLYLIMINTVVNPHFWLLGKRTTDSPLTHAHLQFLLLACIGQGALQKPEEHVWIPTVKNKRNKSKIDELLYQMHPSANYEEIKILRKKYATKEGIKQLGLLFGLSPKDEKEMLKEI